MDAAAGAGIPPVSLVRDAKDALLSSSSFVAADDAHTACIESFTTLLTRLANANERGMSAKKKVAVKGALFHPGVPGIKFSIDYNKGEIVKIRVQTVSDDVDKSAVPIEYGGTGLMAPSTTDDEAAHSDPKPKAKRARTAAPTLHETLETALVLASGGDPDVVAILEALLKRV